MQMVTVGKKGRGGSSVSGWGEKSLRRVRSRGVHGEWGWSWGRPEKGQGWARVLEFFLLKADKARGLGESQRLMGLYLMENLRSEAGDIAAEEERCRKSHDVVCKVFKFGKVCGYCSLLRELEEGPCWVLVLRWRKSGLECL